MLSRAQRDTPYERRPRPQAHEPDADERLNVAGACAGRPSGEGASPYRGQLLPHQPTARMRDIEPVLLDALNFQEKSEHHIFMLK